MIEYTLPKNTKELSAMVSTAINSATSMRVSVQIACVAILHHAYLHGDYSKANDIIEGLGNGIKRDSLVSWFVKFGGLVVDVEAKAFNGWQGKEFIRDNFSDAKGVMWWELKKASNPFVEFIFEDELKKFISRAGKMKVKSEKAKDEAEYCFDVSDETMKQLLKLANFEAVIDPEVV